MLHVSSTNMNQTSLGQLFDIAIVGYSFKLPRGVEDDDDFWDVLDHRRNLMTDWPESRVKTDSFAKNKHQKVVVLIKHLGRV
jgi:acyl transferase domain-containing protein